MKKSRLSTLLAAILLLALGTAGFVTVVNKVTFQPQPVYAGLPPQQVLLLYNSADDSDQELYHQVATALDYAKITHTSADLAAGEQIPTLENYTALVIVTTDITPLDEKQALGIRDYVAGGGGLAVLAPAHHPALDEILGLSGRPEAGQTTINTGIYFVGDLIPGLEGLQLTPHDVGEFAALDVAAAQDVKLLATSGDHARPLVWQRQFDQGRVIYWNNDLLASKPFRGLAVQSVLAVHSGAVMSLVNAGILQVDGFPAPPPAGTEDFYARQWFPDMLELTGRYGVRYTWLANLAGWEEPSLEVEGQTAPFCAYMAYQAERGGHELALQGYGDQPLQEETLQAVLLRWQEDSLGQLPASCAPPAGRYDQAGLAALHAALPSVQVVSATAWGAFEEGGDREFGPEPWAENLFALPRWTSGYTDDDYTRFLALSEMNTLGVWSHSIGAGDPASWDETYSQFDELLNWNEEQHPWLRWLTTAAAYPELTNYFATDAACTFDKAYQITVTFSAHPTYLLLRLNDGRKLDLNSLTNAQIVSYYEGQGYYQYVLRATDLQVCLGLLIPSSTP